MRLGSAVAFDEPATVALVGASRESSEAESAGAVFVFDLFTNRFVRVMRPLDSAIGANFGSTLASADDRLLVGAPGAYSSASGSNSKTGAAYLMTISSGVQRFKLVPPTAAAYDEFGSSVAVHGSRVVVGARAGGYVYLFDAATGVASSRVTPTGGGMAIHFGHSVALDATRIVVGAPRDDQATHADCGAVYVFDASSGAQTSRVVSPAPAGSGHFGYAVATEGSTSTLLVGAPGESSAGRVYAYNETLPSAPFATYIGVEPGGRFGASAACRAGHIIAGSPFARTGNGDGAGFTTVFSPGRDPRRISMADGEAADNFGASVAAGDGGVFLAGMPNHQSSSGGSLRGAAFLFRLAPLGPAVGPPGAPPSPPALPPPLPPTAPDPAAPPPDLGDIAPMLVVIGGVGAFAVLFALVLLVMFYLRSIRGGPRILQQKSSRSRTSAASDDQGQSTTANEAAFTVGQRVIIVGLSNRPDLNSMPGEVVEQRNERGRYTVRIGAELRVEQLAVRPENLIASAA